MLRRKLIVVVIALIMICCTASAWYGIKAGHYPQAASTFFAGLTFSFIFWSLSRRIRP